MKQRVHCAQWCINSTRPRSYPVPPGLGMSPAAVARARVVRRRRCGGRQCAVDRPPRGSASRTTQPACPRLDVRGTTAYAACPRSTRSSDSRWPAPRSPRVPGGRSASLTMITLWPMTTPGTRCPSGDLRWQIDVGGASHPADVIHDVLDCDRRQHLGADHSCAIGVHRNDARDSTVRCHLSTDRSVICEPLPGSGSQTEKPSWTGWSSGWAV